MIDDDQVYVVVDIETDGPVPGLYSMLSLGAVATTKDEETSTFYRRVLPLEGASQELSTMAWWKTQPEAWAEVNTNAQPADIVIRDFAKWIKELNKKPIFVAHPVAFDYAFVSWYLWKFVEKNHFTTKTGAPLALDLTSFIAGKFGIPLKKAKRTDLPEWMRKDMPDHSHNALEDAQGFGVILRNVLQ